MVFLQSLYLRYPSDRRLDPTDGLVATGKSEVPRTCQDWIPLVPVVLPVAQSTSWTWGRDTKRCMQNGGRAVICRRYLRRQKKPHVDTKHAFPSVCLWHITSPLNCWSGQDGSVGIATRCELYGSGFKSSWRRNFPHSSRRPPVPPALMVQELFLEGKATGRWRWPPHLVPSLIMRRTIPLLLPLCLQWLVKGRSLPLPVNYLIFTRFGIRVLEKNVV